MNLENGKAGEREDRPTPETDAECFVNDGDFVTGDFARRLERERDVARENTKAWHGEYRALNDLHRELGLKHKEALRQRDEARENLTKACEDEHRMAVEVANITAQRDRLLEALEALLAGDFRDEAWEFAHSVVAEIKGSAS